MLYRNNILIDLIYRSTKWFLLAFLICYYNDHFSHLAGDFLKRSTKIKSPSELAELFSMIGLILAPIALIIKEINHLCRSHELSSAFISEPSYWLSKLSSDLILIAYGAMFFLIGWGAYLLIYKSHTLNEYIAVLLISPLTIFYTGLLGLISCFIKVDFDHKLFLWWNNFLPFKYRIIIYLMLIPVNIFMLWIAN